jgi:hypothetical protein
MGDLDVNLLRRLILGYVMIPTSPPGAIRILARPERPRSSDRRHG